MRIGKIRSKNAKINLVFVDGGGVWWFEIMFGKIDIVMDNGKLCD